jgi:hypothetical protein
MLENYEAYLGNNNCGHMNYLENLGHEEHMLSDILPDDAIRKVSLFRLRSRKEKNN